MSEFEKTNSSEDLSSLQLLTSELIAISIKMKSSSNLIDMIDGSNLNKVSPKKKFYSMDDIFDASVRKDNPPLGTMSDCVPSPSSGSSYASSSASDSSTGSSSSPTCEISLLERLIRTHPLWFLPSLQRSGALHLLQGREVGNFIVRSSTQPMTMAVSVKLPGNLVEHYLLKAVGNRIALENSTHTFETVHQLIAHYCGTSDEIPVCLRVPNSIAEATTRQQLRSLALLGQEFWSISSNGSGKELSSPSDIEISKNFASSGLGSQSSSSQNSLCDNTNKRPCRPTTLELGICGVSGGGGGTTAIPPPVPLRWSRSALLTPLSQPSSVQSTPSEVQSTFSEKSGRPGKKKKRNSGGNKAESIHYKDTEILDLFKGTKTVYDDKASDYEDIWSPQYYERSHTPRLSTFKPDLIPSSLTPDVDCIQSICHNRNSPNQNQLSVLPTKTKIIEDVAVQNKNIQNHRLSFNGQNINQVQIQISTEDLNKQNNCAIKDTLKEDVKLNNDTNRRSAGLYSEPVDSISFRRFGINRNSEPNIRWSQPVLSLVKLDITGGISEDDYGIDTAGSGKGKSNVIEQKLQVQQENVCRSFHSSISQQSRNITHRSSLADVSLTSNKSASSMCASRVTNSSSNKNNSQKKQTVTCASVDNLCHLRDLSKKSKAYKQRGESGDELERTEVLETSIVAPDSNRGQKTDIIREPQPQGNVNSVDASTNQSWRLDSSWEFVMWQKEEEKRLVDNAAKFPIPTPPNSPFANEGQRRIKESAGDNNSSACSQNEDSLSSTNNNGGFDTSSTNMNRFSRYDNLEGGKTDEDNSSEDCQYEADGQEKISPPWDSSKWEHLLRLVSESTQQLDSLQITDNYSNRNNVNLYANEKPRSVGGVKGSESKPLTSDPLHRISKVIDVSGNVDKAGKAVASVVRDLANKDDGVFGPTLKSFISCTIAAKAQDPHVRTFEHLSLKKVMRNIRQFISGMKNYLVGVNAESDDLRKEIKKQTENLSDCEFLNIDAILEDVLVDLVISPLNNHIRGLIEAHHAENEKPIKSSSSSANNEYFNKAQDSHREDPLDKLRKIYHGFEDSVSPMTKLDKWNEFVCEVQEMENYSSESFLPVLSEMLGNVCCQNLPSHVDYMIGLLPSSLAEQNNYSLSLLQSAISALRAKADASKGRTPITSVRVLVPDERNGTLIRKMVPVRESTTNKDVAKMVASKLGIANPGDYILVTIKNGEEKVCPEGECVYNFVTEGGTALAYKRVDAKIGWPQKIS